MFVTLEGGEGCGKSTLSAALAERLAKAGHEVVRTREPGGSPLAERMRNLILGGAFKASRTESMKPPEIEAVCFAMARSDHLAKVIVPALQRGAIVVCDRFFDSTRAYQGAAGLADGGFLDALEREACGDVRPDLTLILDCPVGIALARARGRALAADRFESEGVAFHEAVRAGFLDIARRDPGRCRIVRADSSAADTLEEAWSLLDGRLPATYAGRR